ncbi:GlxA family transcriptional regulator [Streptomyces beijiangensis]|uniref:Helix-turn-helix domain-containing protein n=1 Tax=Streptomyces beijiangensis TaxID=163361 RepID=A0A939FH46_9ACTN|nr:helix-turn-helix domain-containing protein [Streptomyces beijiangensis]MBO0517317.1 helix-turn-helix domain-containing protein [Streptomyces beijiangensis]
MSPRHRVVALVQPPQSTFELGCAARVFGVAAPGIPQAYDFGVCTEHPGPVPTDAGYDIHVAQGLEALDTADTVVVPGRTPPTAPAPPAVLDALRRAHGRGARIAAICSGAFLVAEAGLLDGRRAATHWRLAEALARHAPRVRVDPDVLYIDHGDVATSGGSAAGIDLCLHLVRADQGAAYAAQVARDMVMPPHREGCQLQYVDLSPYEGRVPESLAPLLAWAADRLGEHIGIDELADHAGLSPRTLARRFNEQLGVSPGRWVLDRRVAAARALLEQSDLPVETVATRVGLHSATNLRRHFHRALRTTPAAYRRAFQQPAALG